MINSFSQNLFFKGRPSFQLSQDLSNSKSKKLLLKIKKNHIYKLVIQKIDYRLIDLYCFKSIFDSILIFQNIALT